MSKRKEIKPNRWHQRVIDLARTAPIVQTNSEKFETKYTSGHKELNPDVVCFCIRMGWLRPQGDGLFSDSSQTYVAA